MTPAQMLAFVETTIQAVQEAQCRAQEASRAAHQAAVRAQDAEDKARAAFDAATNELKRLAQLWQDLNKVVKAGETLAQIPAES